jgi:hypothetical protein
MKDATQWSTRTIQLDDGHLLHECSIQSRTGLTHCTGIISDHRGRFTRRFAATGRSPFEAELELSIIARDTLDRGDAVFYPGRRD